MKIKKISYWLAYIASVMILCSFVDGVMETLILAISISVLETTYPETLGKLPSLLKENS